MVALFLASTLLVPQYERDLIVSAKPAFWRSHVSCTVLSESETVAGFTCDSIGHHGELYAGKPFVWSAGRLHRLPIIKGEEYGHVYAGNNEVLVGSVKRSYRDYPAQWTPDPRLGWSKATLKILSGQEGRATFIGPKGEIYVHKDNSLSGKIVGGKFQTLNFGDFALVGLDSKGRLFGNRHKGVHFGGGPANTKPGVFSNGKWQAFDLIEREANTFVDSYLADVNNDGVSAGKTQFDAAVWKGGKPTLLFGRTRRWSSANDINDLGEIVGDASVEEVEDSMPFLWSAGKIRDLTSELPKLKYGEGLRINNRGSIAVKGLIKDAAHLYLLRRMS